MSDSSRDPLAAPPDVPDAAMPTAPHAVPVAALTGGKPWMSDSWRWLALMTLATSGVLSSLMLWQKLSSIQEDLARRSADSSAQAIEARTLSRQAQDGTRDLAVRLAMLETRLSEVSLQRTQLEELMQSLSRSRDENMVVDIESALRLAQQQAQLTGSAEPLLAALRSADQRLSRAAQPRLNPLQRAIAKDTDRLKSAVMTDVPALLIRVDELARTVDELQLSNAMMTHAANSPTLLTPQDPTASKVNPLKTKISFWELGLDTLSTWSQNTWTILREEIGKLLRVSRIDQPEAALLAPEQSFFLRENLKLRLLNARLALLSRQNESARNDLASAGAALAKYFDPSSRKTQLAIQQLQTLQSQLKTSDLPRLDETFAALTTAAAGR